MWVRSLGQEAPLEWEMAAHFGILAPRISWAEEAGGLQSMRLQRDTTEHAHLTNQVSLCNNTSICWEAIKVTQIYNVYDMTWDPLKVTWLYSTRSTQLYITFLLGQFAAYHSEEGEWFHRIKWKSLLQWASIVCATTIHSLFFILTNPTFLLQDLHGADSKPCLRNGNIPPLRYDEWFKGEHVIQLKPMNLQPDISWECWEKRKYSLWCIQNRKDMRTDAAAGIMPLQGA